MTLASEYLCCYDAFESPFDLFNFFYSFHLQADTGKQGTGVFRIQICINILFEPIQRRFHAVEIEKVNN